MKTLEQVSTRMEQIIGFFDQDKKNLEPKLQKTMFAELQLLKSAKLCLEHYQDENQLKKMKADIERKIRRVESDFKASYDIIHLPQKTISSIRTRFYNKHGVKRYKQQLKFINFLLADFFKNPFINS